MTAPPDRIFVSLHPHGIIMVHLSASPEEGHSEYIRAAMLSDPVTVHLNMLRGTIAKPSLAQIAHIYGNEWTAAIAAARAEGVAQAATVLDVCAATCDRVMIGDVAYHNRDRVEMRRDAFRYAAGKVRALIPAKETP